MLSINRRNTLTFPALGFELPSSLNLTTQKSHTVTLTPEILEHILGI